MGTGNTLDSLLGDILRRETNSIAILDRLQDITISPTDSVTIVYQMPDGEESEIRVPSMGFIRSEITRLSNTVNSLSGIGVNKVGIKLPDGSIRNIFTSSIPSEPEPISGLQIPTNFELQNNPYFEKLTDPNTYVVLPLLGLVSRDTDEVLVRKINVTDPNEEVIDFFNSELQGANDIDYESVVDQLDALEASYETIDDRLKLETKRSVFTGTFSVTNIRTGEVTVVTNGEQRVQTDKFYQLDSLTYFRQDNQAELNLKAGDSLVIDYTDTKRTVYRILEVNTGTFEVRLRRQEGYDTPRVGTGIFRISDGIIQAANLKLPIRSNQRLVIFLKDIEHSSRLANRDWGLGMGLSTNELVENETQSSLSEFESLIADVGKTIKDISRDGVTSFQDSSLPSPPAPVIDESLLSVEIINSHKDQLNTDKEISRQTAEKERINAEIRRLDTEINTAQEDISTANFETRSEELLAQQNVEELNSQRSSLVNQLSIVVNDLASKVRTRKSFSPKYRVKGFIPFPSYGREIINFKYRYRYLRTDNTGVQQPTKSITNETEESITATSSRWVQVVNEARKKTTDSQGEVVWTEENLGDPDANNINEIDIPISQGENVEIQVKIVSEVGYPINPLESGFSESVIIEFPDEFVEDTDSISSQVEEEKTQVKFQQELTRLGVQTHVLNQRRVGENIFRHLSDDIETPFRTPENSPIPLGDQLLQFDSRLNAVEAQLQGTSGQLQVRLLDENGQVIRTVNQNESVDVFGGFYSQIVNSRPVPKGEIVNQIYFVEISNLSQADLSLLSFVPGLRTEAAPDASYTGFLRDDNEYKQARKYWQVPINRAGQTNDSVLLRHHQDNQEPYIQANRFASSQVKGQVIYSRFRDVTLGTDMYKLPVDPEDDSFTVESNGVDGTRTYVWDGSNSDNGGGEITSFSVHTDHPFLADGSAFRDKYGVLYGLNNGKPSANFDSVEVLYPFFSHARYFNLTPADSDGTKQLGFRRYSRNINPQIDELPRKLGFLDEDKFLIGKNTVGAYLTANPIDFTGITTNSVQPSSAVVVRNGDSFAIRFPVLYSVRMTDYDGAGSSGLGVLGGFGSPNANNLEYRKKIGFDITVQNQEVFSFDLSLSMLYRPNTQSDAIGNG